MIYVKCWHSIFCLQFFAFLYQLSSCTFKQFLFKISLWLDIWKLAIKVIFIYVFIVLLYLRVVIPEERRIEYFIRSIPIFNLFILEFSHIITWQLLNNSQSILNFFICRHFLKYSVLFRKILLFQFLFCFVFIWIWFYWHWNVIFVLFFFYSLLLSLTIVCVVNQMTWALVSEIRILVIIRWYFCVHRSSQYSIPLTKLIYFYFLIFILIVLFPFNSGLIIGIISLTRIILFIIIIFFLHIHIHSILVFYLFQK